MKEEYINFDALTEKGSVLCTFEFEADSHFTHWLSLTLLIGLYLNNKLELELAFPPPPPPLPNSFFASAILFFAS